VAAGWWRQCDGWSLGGRVGSLGGQVASTAPPSPSLLMAQGGNGDGMVAVHDDSATT
jgi:hypothetical protein